MKSRWQSSGTIRRLTTRFLVLPCFIGALMGVPVFAQVGGANVGGAITDDSGAVLPGVAITVTNTATGRTQTWSRTARSVSGVALQRTVSHRRAQGFGRCGAVSCSWSAPKPPLTSAGCGDRG
jgi:hypothetical protein